MKPHNKQHNCHLYFRRLWCCYSVALPSRGDNHIPCQGRNLSWCAVCLCTYTTYLSSGPHLNSRHSFLLRQPKSLTRSVRRKPKPLSCLDFQGILETVTMQAFWTLSYLDFQGILETVTRQAFSTLSYLDFQGILKTHLQAGLFL